MKKIFLLLVPFIFAMNSCTTQKKVVTATGEVKDQALTSFYANYQQHVPNFDGVQIKSKIRTDIKGKSLSASLKLYVKNNEQIWANASIFGITGARANITPNKVQAYSVLEREYIDSNFDYFNNILKVNFINYERLQELLLGQLFLIKDLNQYEVETTSDNQYVLTYKGNQELERNPKKNEYIHTFYLDSNYRLRKVEITDPTSKTDIIATYDEWQLLEGKNFPSLVKVLINGKQKDKIELDYTNFVFEDVNPPFRIPKGYTEKIIK